MEKCKTWLSNGMLLLQLSLIDVSQNMCVLLLCMTDK